MRAAVLPEVGAGLRVEELRDPRPHAGEVLVRVRACGVCHTDLHVTKGEVKVDRASRTRRARSASPR